MVEAPQDKEYLEKLVQDSLLEISRLRMELLDVENHQGSMGDCEEAINKLKEDHERLIQSKNQLIAEKDKIIAEQNEKIGKLDGSIPESGIDRIHQQNLKNEIESLKELVKKRNTQLKDLEDEFKESKADFEKKLSDKESELSGFKENTDYFDSIRNALKADIDEYKDTTKKLLDDQISTLNSEVSNLKEDISKKDTLILELENSTVSKKSFQELQRELRDKNQRIANLEQVDLDSSSGQSSLDDIGSSDEISRLQDIIKDKEADSVRMKEVFNILTSKPLAGLTSIQSQIFSLMPESGESHEIHNLILDIGFEDISFINFVTTLKSLEKKGYLVSEDSGNSKVWRKVQS